MASLMATQDSIMGVNRALTSLSDFLDSNPVRPAAFVERTKGFIHGAYDAMKTLLPSLVGTRSASGITTNDLADLESGVNVPEIPNTGHEPEDHPFDNTENSEDVRQNDMGEQLGPVEALSSHSYYALMGMVGRFVGPLSLIVVPGLVVGVATGQLPWAIALCGAIATILSFFGGLRK